MPYDDVVARLERLRLDPTALPRDITPEIRAVQQRRLRQATPVLRRFLRETDLTVVSAACETLAALGAREAIPDLLDLLPPGAERERKIFCDVDPFGWYEPMPYTSAAEALGLLGAREAVPLLAARLADEDPNMREACVKALTRLDARGHTAAVAPLLVDEWGFVRDAAAAYLKRFPR